MKDELSTVEALELQVKELFLKDKKREKQFQTSLLKNKRLESQINEKIENQNKRLTPLEQKFEKTKPVNLYDLENNILFKHFKEAHKIYSQICKRIFLRFNPIISCFIITGSFISLYQ